MATKKSTAPARAAVNSVPSRRLDKHPAPNPSEELARKERAARERIGRNVPHVALTDAAPEDIVARSLREGQEEAISQEKRKKRILKELDRRGIDPNCPRGKQARNRFLRPASEVNVALLQVAVLELESPEIMQEYILQLNDSFMHRRVDDEWYFGQDDTRETLSDLGVTNYGYLQMHARIYLAGKIAGRDEEQRRRLRRP